MTETRDLIARFSIPGEPASKARARFTKRGNKVHSYTPEKTKQAEAGVAKAFLEQAKRRFTDPEIAYAISADFYHATLQRRDVDNMLKLVLDGLNGWAYPDDVQVQEVVGRKHFVEKPEARTEVEVYTTGTIKRRMDTCTQCGKEYRTHESWQNAPRARRFCSQECYWEQQAGLRQRKCHECGEAFEAHSPESATKYCSIACKSSSGRVEMGCDHCGETFNKQKAFVREANYCTDKCMRAARSIRRKSRMAGTCRVCGGGTTRKEYTRCNDCRIQQESVIGKPRKDSP